MMKILKTLFILFVCTIMWCSCDNDEFNDTTIININNSYNNTNDNDSTKNNNNNVDTTKKGTISFGVSDVEKG